MGGGKAEAEGRGGVRDGRGGRGRSNGARVGVGSVWFGFEASGLWWMLQVPPELRLSLLDVPLAESLPRAWSLLCAVFRAS